MHTYTELGLITSDGSRGKKRKRGMAGVRNERKGDKTRDRTENISAPL